MTPEEFQNKRAHLLVEVEKTPTASMLNKLDEVLQQLIHQVKINTESDVVAFHQELQQLPTQRQFYVNNSLGWNQLLTALQRKCRSLLENMQLEPLQEDSKKQHSNQTVVKGNNNIFIQNVQGSSIDIDQTKA